MKNLVWGNYVIPLLYAQCEIKLQKLATWLSCHRNKSGLSCRLSVARWKWNTFYCCCAENKHIRPQYDSKNRKKFGSRNVVLIKFKNLENIKNSLHTNAFWLKYHSKVQEWIIYPNKCNKISKHGWKRSYRWQDALIPGPTPRYRRQTNSEFIQQPKELELSVTTLMLYVFSRMITTTKCSLPALTGLPFCRWGETSVPLVTTPSLSLCPVQAITNGYMFFHKGVDEDGGGRRWRNRAVVWKSHFGTALFSSGHALCRRKLKPSR